MSWQWQGMQGYAAGSGHGYDYMASSSTSTYKSNKTQQPRQNREQHMAKLEIWLCKICNKEYGSKSALNRHFTTVHEQPKPRPIQDVPRAMVPYRATPSIVCNLCGKDFASQGNLTRHLNTVHQRVPQGHTVTKNTKVVQKTKTNVTINMYNPNFYNYN